MPNPDKAKNERAPAIAVISIAFMGLLLFIFAALAPAFEGQIDGSATVVLAGLGALMLGISIFGALLMVLIGARNNQE